jgi:hypothetical protein
MPLLGTYGSAGGAVGNHRSDPALRYHTDRGDYADRGNKCIGWLTKLLSAPNRQMTVGELKGDPEGKLKADALLGGESETDRDGIMAMRKRLDDIEGIISETGSNESLEREKEDVLNRLKDAVDRKQLDSPLKSAHHNIATQIRTFLKKLSEGSMPQLAAHLKASLKLEFPHFG